MSAKRAAQRIERLQRNMSRYIASPSITGFPRDGQRFHDLNWEFHRVYWDTWNTPEGGHRWEPSERAFRQVVTEIIEEEMK